MFELTFGYLLMARKPIINGGDIRPTGLLLWYSVIFDICKGDLLGCCGFLSWVHSLMRLYVFKLSIHVMIIVMIYDNQ